MDLKRTRKVTKLLLVILTLSVLFVFLTNYLININESFIESKLRSGKYSGFIQELDLYSANGFQHILSVDRNSLNKVNHNHIEIRGKCNTISPYQEITIEVNGKNSGETNITSNGSFSSKIILAKGLNEISITRRAKNSLTDFYSFDVFYRGNTKFKPTEPTIIYANFSNDSSKIEFFGLGEPDTVSTLKINNQVSFQVRTDIYGTFHYEMFLDSFENISKNTIDLNFNSGKSSVVGFSELISQNVFSRKTVIRLDVQKNILYTTFSSILPSNSTPVQNQKQGLINTQDFISQVFGRIDFADKIISTTIHEDSMFSYVDILLSKNDFLSEGKATIEIRPGNTILSRRPLLSKNDSIIVYIPDSINYSCSFLPDNSAKDTKIFTGKKDFKWNKFIFRIDKNNSASPYRSSSIHSLLETFEPDPVPENIIEIVRELPGKVLEKKFIAPFKSIFAGLLFSIPFFWLLLLLNNCNIIKNRVTFFRKIILLILFLVLAEYILDFALHITELIGTEFKDFFNRYNLFIYTKSFFHYAIFTIIISVLIIKKTILSWPNERKNTFIKKALYSSAVWIALLTYICITGYISSEHFQNTFGEFSFGVNAVIVGILCLIIIVAVNRILKRTLHVTLRINDIILPLLFLLTYIPLLSLYNNVNHNFKAYLDGNVIWSIYTSVVGAIFIYFILKIIFEILGKKISILSKNNRFVLILLLLITAFPKEIIFSSDRIAISYSLGLLNMHIVDLFVYLCLLIVLLILYWQDKEEKKETNQFTIDAGVFLFAIFVVQYGYYWFYIPITLILAYWLTRKILFQKLEAVAKEMETYSSVLNTRKQSIQNVINHLKFKKQLRSIRKKNNKDLSESQIDYQEWKNREEKNMKLLLNYREKCIYNDKHYKKIVFAFNNNISSWDDAVRTIKIGIIFAIPLLFIAIRDFRLANSDINYPVLSILDIFLNKVSVWIILAFVFGYYYDFIKGRTGIEKALWISLVVVIARIGPAVFFADSLPQVAKILTFGVEIIIYSVLLGFFSFDFNTLRKNGFGWNEVVIFYNLTFLSSFGSTLIIAFAGILSGKLQELLSVFLDKLFG